LLVFRKAQTRALWQRLYCCPLLLGARAVRLPNEQKIRPFGMKPHVTVLQPRASRSVAQQRREDGLPESVRGRGPQPHAPQHRARQAGLHQQRHPAAAAMVVLVDVLLPTATYSRWSAIHVLTQPDLEQLCT